MDSSSPPDVPAYGTGGGRDALVREVVELLCGHASGGEGSRATRASGAKRRRSVVLRGPAGIGKSHLASQVADELEGVAAVAVRRVSGGESQQFLDFGALLHLLPLDGAPVTAEFELLQRLRQGLVEHDTATVVVVDDVGMLDRKSAAVLESLIRAGDISVLATERTEPDGQRQEEHHLSAVLANHAEPLLIGALDASTLAALVVEWAGPGEVGSIRRLSAMSEGNPLALRELIESARASNSMSSRDGLWHLDGFVPSGRSLEQLVEKHLSRLTEPEWDLMRGLAIAGSVPRAVLARLDVSALEQLERASLVSGDPTRLDHPLYAGVIRAQLVGEETRRLYSKLASAVSPDDGVDPARLAEWMLDAGAGIDDRSAREGAAVAIGRWENALAQRLISSISEPTVADLVQLLWSHANEGDLERASEIAEHAVDVAQSETEWVDAELARAELWCLQLGRSDDAAVRLAELRTRLRQPDQVARVDGATALFMRMTGKGPQAGIATQAASASEVTTDDGRMSIALAEAFGQVFGGRFDSGSAAISEAYELAERLQKPHNAVRVGIIDAVRHLLTGRLDQADEVVDRWLRAADVSLVRPAHAVWLGLAAQLAGFRGDHERAVLRGREAARAADHVDDIGAGGFVRGELRAAVIELGGEMAPDANESPLGGARAELRLLPDDLVDDAAARLTQTALDAGYVLWAPFVGLEAVRRGPAPASASLVIEASEAQEGPFAAALVAFATGSRDRDLQALATAVDAFLAIDANSFALDALVNELEVGVEVNGDVLALRRHALAARSVGARMTPHVPPRAAARLLRIGELLDMPSDRQLEIARLVARGLTSKEVAAELIVSARTVDNHLAAVYRKLGLSSRAELGELPL